MTADSDDRRAADESGSERLSLRADAVGADEQFRALGARLRRAETELERARKDLAAERDDRVRDADWFRQALAELRAAAEQAQASGRGAEELRAAIEARDAQLAALRAELHEAREAVGARDALLTELREAVGARDALLAELRDELDRRVHAESETLSALDALRERAAVPPPEPPAAPVEEPATAAEPPPAPILIGPRFERRPAWPEGTTELARAEIDWQAGYINSRFRVIVYHPNRKRGTIAATGSNYKWLLMGEPAPESPEFVAEVERLAAALEEAGWEEIGEGGPAWFSRRYVWRHAPPAPDELRPKPLEAFQRS